MIAVFIFAPGIILALEFTAFASIMVIQSAFTFGKTHYNFGVGTYHLHCSRSSAIRSSLPLIDKSENSCFRYLDSRESGPLIISHIYLLYGCFMPIALGN